MITITYFVTTMGYCIEAIRDEILIDDRREMISNVSRDVLLECALSDAFEMAARHNVDTSTISYDADGEATEEKLFG